MNLSHYALLAGLFDYPDAATVEKVKKILSFLDKTYPEAHEALSRFLLSLSRMTVLETQELYTRSFDVQAATTLDMGYVLFGDDYKRGELLANLNREHRKYQNNCGAELADHLPNVVRLLAKLEDQGLMGDLVSEMIIPALKKMISDFDPKRLQKRSALYKKHYKTLIECSKDKATMYGDALKALLSVLVCDFHWVERPQPSATVNFLKSVNQEIEIEDRVCLS